MHPFRGQDHRAPLRAYAPVQCDFHVSHWNRTKVTQSLRSRLAVESQSRHSCYRCASGCVVERRICNWEAAGSNLGRGYFAPRSTQPTIPPGSVNEYQLQAKAGMAHSDCG